MQKIPFYQAQTLKESSTIKHGFFGNKGGVSSGVHTSLNCGAGSADDPDNVKVNRDLVMQALGYKDSSNLYSLYQIHSDKVIYLDKVPETRLEADAIVTNKPGIALSVLTADCGPILFADAENKVIAAAHAGHKGAKSGIIENTIKMMLNYGAKLGKIKAVVGPTIAQASYEIGPEFYENFVAQEASNKKFFIVSQKNGHFMFDLPAYILQKLQQSGIKTIEDLQLDTCKREDEFFSYRRNCLNNIKDYGRNIAVIVQ